MTKHNILFIDRDGTLLIEPPDQQVDHINKLIFMPQVVPALLKLKDAGYRFVMVTNQDGLGTESFPYQDFSLPQECMLNFFLSQGIEFCDVLICPHFEKDNCHCRKPNLGLVMNYLVEQKLDRENSYVIGDRQTDMQFADNLGIPGLLIGNEMTWNTIADHIINKDRRASIERKTNETTIVAEINLDKQNALSVQTGIAFFDHMLEQLAKHAGINMILNVKGDLHVDDHHTVEDTGIVIGNALRKALGDKRGINRYGFTLPMDEALASVAIDLSGRSYFVFKGELVREQVGGLSTELVSHFFRSFADGLSAAIHIEITGENTHHMIEAAFKGVGRALRQAIQKSGDALPTTKGVL